ncbi:MAG: hypothetical protein ABFS05_10265 [Bacteroidota bacterium]
MKLLFYILGIVIITGTELHAQEAIVDAHLDTTDILIGDQIQLNIAFSMPLDSRVIWPFYKDTLAAHIEIISMSAVDTIIHEGENLVDMMQTITITSFDSGYYHIPPIKFQYQALDDTTFKEVSSMPMYLMVHTMEVDTANAIRVIKAPLEAPFTLSEIMPWILMALAAIVISLLVVYILTRIKRKQPIFKIRPKPVLPPYVVAMDGLESLKEKKLWQAGKTKEFYTELTDIIRIYIEGRFKVPAVEMTTEEILDGIKDTDSPQGSSSKLADTLVLADLVKFAKEKPMPLDNENSLSHCVDFVTETRPVSNEEESKTEEPISGIRHPATSIQQPASTNKEIKE